MLSEACIRAGWETQRASIKEFLLKEKKFNPRTVDKAVTTYIESVSFARLPCGKEEAIKAMFAEYVKETVKAVTA